MDIKLVKSSPVECQVKSSLRARPPKSRALAVRMGLGRRKNISAAAPQQVPEVKSSEVEGLCDHPSGHRFFLPLQSGSAGLCGGEAGARPRGKNLSEAASYRD